MLTIKNVIMRPPQKVLRASRSQEIFNAWQFFRQ